MTAGTQVRIGGIQPLPQTLTEMSPAEVHNQVRQSGITRRSRGAERVAVPQWRFRDDYLMHIKDGGCPYR